MRRLAFLPTVLLLFPGSQTVAQTLLVEPGTRVRVVGCGARNGHQMGTFDGLRGDTLFLGNRAATIACPLSSLEGLQVFGGWSSRWKRGAVIGAIAGGLPFGVIGVVLSCMQDGWWLCQGVEWVYPAGIFAIGAGGGGLIGGVIGFFFKTEKWEAVPIHPRLLFVR